MVRNKDIHKAKVSHSTQAVLIFLLLCCTCISTEGYFIDDYVLPKWAAIRLSVPVTAAFLIIVHRHNLKEIKVEACAVYLFLFILTAISCKEAIIPYLFFLILSTFIFRYYNSESEFTIAILISGIILLFKSIIQFYDNEPITGGFDTSAALALHLSLTSPYALKGTISNEYYYRKTYLCLCILYILMTTTVLIAVGSRLGIIAFCISAILIFKPKKRLPALLFVLGITTMCMHVKKDSTKGRSLIYYTSLTLIDSPHKALFGLGEDGFNREYMRRQSKVLKESPYEQGQLADNIRHPLNELLLAIINYGVLRVGGVVFILVLVFRKTAIPTETKASISILLLFAFFSYPFRYPIAWLILAKAAALSFSQPDRSHTNNRIVLFSILVISVTLIYNTIAETIWNREWEQAHERARFANDKSALAAYCALSKSQYANDMFYYDYAAVLLGHKQSSQAIKILNNSATIDYDTQLLRGDIYADLHQYDKAISHYEEAASMCPNRFLPLYNQYKVYEEKKDTANMTSLRNVIINKTIKVPSYEIMQMRHDVTH